MREQWLECVEVHGKARKFSERATGDIRRSFVLLQLLPRVLNVQNALLTVTLKTFKAAEEQGSCQCAADVCFRVCRAVASFQQLSDSLGVLADSKGLETLGL